MMNLYLTLAIVCLLVADVSALAAAVGYGKACTSSGGCTGSGVVTSCPTITNKKFCVCEDPAGNDYTSALIGSPAKGDCQAKCDTDYPCGIDAECNSDKTGCTCKTGKIYDSTKRMLSQVDQANWNCKDSSDIAGCKSAHGSTTDVIFTAPNCACSNNKVLTVQKDGKYSCEGGSGSGSCSGSGSPGIYALGIAIMAAIAMLG